MLYSSEQRGGRTAFHQLSTDLGPEALPCIFDLTFEQARRSGLHVEGPRALVRRLPGWFDRYLFANVAPAQASGE